MNEPTRELEAYFAGDATDEQIRIVEAWINADPANAKSFMQQLHFRELVGQHIREQADQSGLAFAELARVEERRDEIPPIRIDDNALTKQKYVGALSYVFRHTFTPRRLITGGIAAALLLAAVMTIVLMGGPEPVDQQPVVERPDQPDVNPSVVATLTDERDAVWERRPGHYLYAGQHLTLTQGFAEITTKRGAVAILEAPATIELADSDNAIRLIEGKLVGLCYSKSSKGFVVHTDFADVTDLGTEFGVIVSDQGFTASVFTGFVELSTPEGNTKRLVHNQSATRRVGEDEPLIVADTDLDERFADLLRPALVTSAAINLPGFELEVVPRGVREDVRLHTDRTHELNSLDAAGLPSALIAGDLIRTPADARSQLGKNTEGMQIEIEVAQPVTVYLLYSGSNSPLPWIERDYELTQMRVGMDFDLNQRRGWNSLGIGPGQGIDRMLAVWQRKDTVTGRAVVAEHAINSPYSLIVVPVAQSN